MMSNKIIMIIILMIYSFLVGYVISATIDHYGIISNTMNRSITAFVTTILIVAVSVFLYRLIIVKANNQ